MLSQIQFKICNILLKKQCDFVLSMRILSNKNKKFRDILPEHND